MLLDVDYILLGLPGVALSGWAWWKGGQVRARATREESSSGLSGAEAALRVMAGGGCEPVPIDVADGPLADHYDAGRRRLRLSGPVQFGRSPAALGIATHEAGHVLQAAARSPWAVVRHVLVPVAALGSILSWLLLGAGITLGFFRLTVWGLAVFSLTVGVQLINLGAERDASRRAREAMTRGEGMDEDAQQTLAPIQAAAEWDHVGDVLTAFPAWIAHAAGLALRTLRMEA